MVGWCKLKSETADNMTIAYSLETNQSCDGQLIFDKKTKKITVSKITSGEYQYLTSAFICPLRNRIRKGMELDKKYMVMTG